MGVQGSHDELPQQPEAAPGAQLQDEVDRVRRRLEVYLGEAPSDPPPPPAPFSPSPLEYLVHTFGLSPFERDVLVLCAAMEISPDIAQLVGRVAGDPSASFPTPMLALAVLEGGAMLAFSPSAPLRKWDLILMSDGLGMSLQISIEEALLHYLLSGRIDERTVSAWSRYLAAGEPSS